MNDRISRRDLLRTTGTLAAAGLVAPWLDLGARPAGAAALRAVPMAMHVHASFSEGRASMESQLAQAAANGVEVLWWTEHDWRMSAYGYRRVVHFDAMTEEEDGMAWTWVPTPSGALTGASGGIVATPASPLDPNPPASLRVAGTGTGASFSTNLYRADDGPANANGRASLAGQRLQIEVFPQRVGPDAFCEIRIDTSNRPAREGRPGGQYVLSYRLGGPDAPGTRRASGRNGYVSLASTPGRWNSLTLTPAADLGAVWPGVDGRDASLNVLYVGVGSRNGSPAAGCFDYLRFGRSNAGVTAPLRVQEELMAAYASEFPGITQRRGLEVSRSPYHVNRFGGALTLPDYGSVPASPSVNDPDFSRGMVDAIHRSGGVASYNHPFGSDTGLVPEAQQATRLRSVAGFLLREQALGADVLEVGYPARGGVSLARHLAAWDVCSRNALFLTGNGVNDNHGAAWRNEASNFLTWAWAPGPGEAALLAAMRAGRLYFGNIARFRGTLDLLVDDTFPMGSASRSSEPTRRVAVAATGIPAGGGVRVVQGVVDYAGPSVPEQSVQVSTLAASAFAGGGASVVCDNRRSSFVRVEVVDAAGVVVAGSNPVWLLREEPPRGIPAARA